LSSKVNEERSYSVQSQEKFYNKGIIIQINFKHKNTSLNKILFKHFDKSF
jgi:hypothetical protein